MEILQIKNGLKIFHYFGNFKRSTAIEEALHKSKLHKSKFFRDRVKTPKLTMYALSLCNFSRSYSYIPYQYFLKLIPGCRKKTRKSETLFKNIHLVRGEKTHPLQQASAAKKKKDEIVDSQLPYWGFILCGIESQQAPSCSMFLLEAEAVFTPCQIISNPHHCLFRYAFIPIETGTIFFRKLFRF